MWTLKFFDIQPRVEIIWIYIEHKNYKQIRTGYTMTLWESARQKKLPGLACKQQEIVLGDEQEMVGRRS